MRKSYFWKIKVETDINGLYSRYYRDRKSYNKTDAIKDLTEQLAEDLNSFPFLHIEDILLSADGTQYTIEKLGRIVSIERFEK